MMNWTDLNGKAVEMHLHELRARTEQERLVRQAKRVRSRQLPHHWRRIGVVLRSLLRRPTGLRGAGIDDYGWEEIA